MYADNISFAPMINKTGGLCKVNSGEGKTWKSRTWGNTRQCFCLQKNGIVGTSEAVSGQNMLFYEAPEPSSLFFFECRIHFSSEFSKYGTSNKKHFRIRPQVQE